MTSCNSGIFLFDVIYSCSCNYSCSSDVMEQKRPESEATMKVDSKEKISLQKGEKISKFLRKPSKTFCY